MLAADPKLAEFMEPRRVPRSKQKIWDNQDVTAFGAAGDGDGDLHARLRDEKPAFEDDGSDDDAYDQDLDDDAGKVGAAKGVKRQPARNARKRRPIGGGADDGSESDSFDVSDESDVSSESDESESDTDDQGVDALAADDGVSDMDYLKKRRRRARIGERRGRGRARARARRRTRARRRRRRRRRRETSRKNRRL